MKYLNTLVGFREFPDEISLLINITGCCFHCLGCHSPELWEDIGTPLSISELDKLIQANKGITCVGFMGGNLKEINPLAEYIKNIDPPLKVGWYTGGIIEESELLKLEFLDYVKTGPYIKELGGLDSPSTNQRFYIIQHLSNKTRFYEYRFYEHRNYN
jgi:anaerobic ribonucleoside-triphosphate reductase activating protein